jgi:hypothetical protein
LVSLLLDSQDDEATHSEGEEQDIDDMLDAAGTKPKVKDEVYGWIELCEQIKDDQQQGHRQNKSLTHMNQLSIVRNFATLCIKGMRHMAASEAVAQQWHNGMGIHFAYQIRFLARHYQLFEQLPTKRQGGDRGYSLLNKEDIQVAARAHLSSLPTGDVTPKQFHHTLHK